MSVLLELAERCELGHTDYQRTLLSDAAYAVFGDESDHREDPAFWPKAVDFTAKLRAQAYIDAAMTLVPEGRVVRLVFDYPGQAKCGVCLPGVIELRTEAATPALALCAAALRARAASADTHPEGQDRETGLGS